MMRWLSAACLAAALCLLPGCASLLQAPQTEALVANRPADLPLRVALSATPFFPQTALQCGPAALATVMGASGLDVSPEALIPQVFVPGRGGSLQIEMLAAARRHGRAQRASACRSAGHVDRGGCGPSRRGAAQPGPGDRADVALRRGDRA
ncbi:MAG: hypothetical protein QM742_14630 [Aquabacterium sp.]